MPGVKSAALSGICLSILLLLAGCSDLSAPEGGEFEPVREGVLTVATDTMPQPGFWEGEPEPEGGFEWSLAQQFAERFGLDRVEIVERPFEALIAGDLGGADMAMTQITPTSERDEVLDFSVPYLSANPAVLVADDLSIRDVMQARDLTWAVQKGTTLEQALEQHIVPHASVRHLETQPDVVAAVREGDVDAALLDLPVALAYARDDSSVTVAAQIASDETLAVALPQDSPNREAVNTAIRAMTNEGVLTELAEEWLGAGLRAGTFTVEEVRLLRTK